LVVGQRDMLKGRKYYPGYHADIDAVSISYDGSFGEITVIEGLRILLPKIKDPFFADKPKAEQYWQRTPIPQHLNSETADRHRSYIDKQYQYKKYGVHFKNNGGTEYITGPHWFLMAWCITSAENGGYYYFSKAQQKLFYYLEASWCDERCYGIDLTKIRRFGATDCAVAFYLCKGITRRKTNFGMTSKTDVDARKNFQRQMEMFKGLPFFFKPINKGESTRVLEFREPLKKVSKSYKELGDQTDALDTEFGYMATAESSYDGFALGGYIGDEFSKWKKANGNTLKHWGQIKKTFTSGSIIRGHAFILSTVEFLTGEDPDSEAALAGDRFKKLYFDSIPAERDRNGRTRSGLYKIFISVYEHYDGHMDRYGYPVIETPEKPLMGAHERMITIGIKELIENEIAPFKDDPIALNDYLRKTPIKEEDAFRIESSESMFNIVKLNQQIMHNDVLEIDNDLPIRIGNFRWVKNIPDTIVEFVDEPHGRFYLGWMPPRHLQNQYDMVNALKSPANKHIGVLGIDTYRVSQTTDGRGSKGSIHGISKPNGAGLEANKFFLEYVARPATKEIFFEDAIMACVFFGMQALIENNVAELLHVMYKRGLTRYAMRRPDKPKAKLSYDEKKYGGIPGNSESLINAQASAIEAYIQNYVGNATIEGYGRMIGEIGDMPFTRTLIDWSRFNIQNRTKRDASVSSGLALFAAQQHMRIPDHENKPRELKGIITLYKK